MALKIKILFLAAVFSVSMLLCAGCTQRKAEQMKDGYYTAERIDFHPGNGWKEYVTIYVRSNKIVTVEYNAKNPSGFIKSWDMKYMYDMRNFITYPNHYTRKFAGELFESSNPEGITAITGATHSHLQFQELAKAVLAKAKAGDKTVAKVYYTLHEFEIVPSLLARFDEEEYKKANPSTYSVENFELSLALFERECVEHNYFSANDLSMFRQKYLGV